MFDFHPQLKQRFAALRTGAEFFSLRYVRESGQHLSVRKNVAEPPSLSRDEGAMLTARVNGVEAYAATNDLSQAGLQAALERAEQQARREDRRVDVGLAQRDAGCTLEDVVKTTVWLTDAVDYPAFNAAYAERFPADQAPARSTVIAGLDLVPAGTVTDQLDEYARLYGAPNPSHFVKDAFHRAVVARYELVRLRTLSCSVSCARARNGTRTLYPVNAST